MKKIKWRQSHLESRDTSVVFVRNRLYGVVRYSILDPERFSPDPDHTFQVNLDLNPDHTIPFKPVLRIQIRIRIRIHVFLGLQDPDPDPSIIIQKK
jgi:hypothetical protein